MVTAVVGAAYGSEGKGAFIAKIAHKFGAAVRTGGPNAGHSLWHEGKVWKMRSVPVPFINPNCQLILGAGAVIDPEVLFRELEETGRSIFIDHQAVVILPADREEEEHSALTKMGSTLEGVGAARIKKIRRDVDAPSPLAKDHFATVDTVRLLKHLIAKGDEVILEGTQGSGLSLHHGQWPYVTSNDTNVSQLLADAGIPPTKLKHTILVARTYPIRVGGPSGPMEDEKTWEEMGVTPERTTVTNKIRRISGWDSRVYQRALDLNDPCGVVLTFMDYVDPSLAGVTYPASIYGSKDAMDMIKKVEYLGVPVVTVGTGGERFEMVPIGKCKHGEVWV